MYINKKAETFAGIIIGVAILSVILLGIGNLMYYSYDVLAQFKTANRIDILQGNVSNMVAKLDTSDIIEGEIFYVYKNNTTKNFETFTGSTNVEYKYVDKYGEKVDDLVGFNGQIYSRVLWKERSDTSLISDSEVIRADIKRLIKK